MDDISGVYMFDRKIIKELENWAEKENRKSEEIRCEGCQTVLINGWEKEE